MLAGKKPLNNTSILKTLLAHYKFASIKLDGSKG